ncbi:MAG: PorT family protein [Prevotella sp.]|nr:PorT family protein [Prevotella sp.]MBP5506538.1 PorT family protein [Prevotella sp.]
MKKMIFAATAMMMVAMSVSAQREVGSLTLQPKFGGNISVVYMDDKNLDYEKAGGMVAGAELEYRVAKWFAVSAGAMYSQEGGKTKIKDLNMVEKVNLDYITAPVMANFYVWKGLALKVGIEPAFKIHDKYDVPAPIAASKYEFNDIKSFDLRTPIGISYDFGGLTLDLRLNAGRTKIMKDKDFFNGSGQLTIGYKFALK